MNLKFNKYTKVFSGINCVLESKDFFSNLGKVALVVTGETSAVKSGALDDVIKVLESNGVKYQIFNRVQNNPSIESISEAMEITRDSNPDFIIGIGGGSPMDVAKALSILAANEDLEPIDLLKNKFDNKPLKVICIPTVAGSGSEVTQYSVLTCQNLQTKKAFGNKETFPYAVFANPEYTKSVASQTNINTAVDALSNAVEGYICKNSSTESDILAIECIKLFQECIEALRERKFNMIVRERMFELSLKGGDLVSKAGCTLLHAMGYSLTYFHGVPHGMANGLLFAEYLKYNSDVQGEKIQNVLDLLKMNSIDEFKRLMDEFFEIDFTLSDEEIDLYAQITIEKQPVTVANNPKTASLEDVRRIIKESLS